MRKLFIFGLLFLILSISVSASYMDWRNDPYQGYVPDDASYAYSRYGSPYYDPVIFGGLGNSYYRGGYVDSGFPLAGSRYVPFGNIYRYDGNSYGGYDTYGYGYDSPYNSYGYGGYNSGYNSYGYNSYNSNYGYGCLTGCPGYGAPINRPFGVGY